MLNGQNGYLDAFSLMWKVLYLLLFPFLQCFQQSSMRENISGYSAIVGHKLRFESFSGNGLDSRTVNPALQKSVAGWKDSNAKLDRIRMCGFSRARKAQLKSQGCRLYACVNGIAPAEGVT